LISGGGTGGHIFPALAVAQALAELVPGVELLYVGRAGGIEERIVPGAGIELETIKVRGIQEGVWRNLPLAATVPAAVARASSIVGRFKPDAVFGTGGYVVGPVGMAASLRRKPLVLQLPDAVPGRTIRLLAPRAAVVCVAFGSSVARLRGRAVVTGTPLRPEFAALGRARREQPRQWPTAPRRVVVFGGSQGAHRLNTAVAEGLKDLLEGSEDLTVHHLCGENDREQLHAMRSGLLAGWRERYVVEGFSDDMDRLMASADLVLARAGGSAVAEMTAVGVPMILVPYPYAGDHQRFNAEPLERAGAAVVVPDREFSGVRLVQEFNRLSEPGRLARMAAASLAWGRPDAALEVAGVVRDAARGSSR
jgi:UDP-N-acetylglucosamine--N-acetylmuramyl-(pentapeptide) pyrophosphoryl-undecaprenol N-acetylglucosamine transferase